jgi:CBS domain-containing protein
MAAYLQARPLRDVAVVSVMAPEPATCRDSHTLAAALGIMRARQLRRLPVVDGGGRLVGMVSLTDCARAAAVEHGGDGAEHLARAVARTLAAVGAPRC